jgi:hypothetical protein
VPRSMLLRASEEFESELIVTEPCLFAAASNGSLASTVRTSGAGRARSMRRRYSGYWQSRLSRWQQRRVVLEGLPHYNLMHAVINVDNDQ